MSNSIIARAGDVPGFFENHEQCAVPASLDPGRDAPNVGHQGAGRGNRQQRKNPGGAGRGGGPQNNHCTTIVQQFVLGNTVCCLTYIG